MDLCEFLHVHHNCPVCGEPLTLYCQILDGPLWKAQRISTEVWGFEQFKNINKDFQNHDDWFWLTDTGNNFDIEFSSSKIYQSSKTWTLFFFYMCNEDSVEEVPGEGYGINPYLACYVATTPFLEFKENQDKHWRLALSDPFDTIAGNVRDEIFTFKAMQPNGNEKVYILNIDNETKATILRYYVATPEEMKDKDFEPKVLKLDLPQLGTRPNFNLEDRQKLIDRFDGWIIMS